MREVYLSAHLDDAVLSCGGMIFDRAKMGIPIEVWTMMCAIPRDKAPDNYQKRMREDAAACKRVGATPIHYCFLDALDRRNAEGAKLYDTVFTSVHPDDKTLFSLTSILKHSLMPGDTLVCPLAVGNHVDHVILRKATERLKVTLQYYPDFPYTEYLPDALEPAALGLTSHLVSITPDGLEHWLDAACEYVSQDLYPTKEITRTKITEYWQKARGIFTYRKER